MVPSPCALLLRSIFRYQLKQADILMTSYSFHSGCSFGQRSLWSSRTSVVYILPWLSNGFVCRRIHSFLSSRVGWRCLERPFLEARLFATQASTKRSSFDDTSSKAEEEEKRLQMEKVRRNTRLGLTMMFASFAGCVVYALVSWGAPPKDEQGFTITDEFSDMPKWKQYILRTWKEVKFYEKYFKEPSREQLLPDPLKEPYVQPPYTLVVELSGVLVHPDWTYQTGWRFKKRPAVEYFIQQIGYPMFEVVIYTAEQGFTASPIVDNLDPNGLIMYRLYRDATKYTRGHHVKDLSRLNRDLSKVILLDWDPRSFQLQPENALRLPKWEGSDDDTILMDLAALLRAIATSGTKDVRPILEYYNSFVDPIEAFREKQKFLLEEQERQFSAQRKDSLTKPYASRLFRLNKAM